MTVTARKVLRDLRHAHELLEGEDDTTRFRVLWVAAISLSRAVGHVLKKVDYGRSVKLSSEIDKAYSRWKSEPESNQIFYEFIDNERNSVLKEYEFGYLSGSTNIVVAVDGQEPELESLDLLCHLSEGIYAGEDCRDILLDAIEWWEIQLKEIECAASI